MFQNKRKVKDYIFKSVLFSFTISFIIYISYSLGLFYGLENFFEDILFRERPIDSRIVILSIDNDSINKIGQWPWPRSVFAEALLNLEKAGPMVVGLDVIMPETSRLGFEDDLRFADSLNKISYPLVVPVEAKNLNLNEDSVPFSDQFLKPINSIQKGKSVKLAHINLIADKDGIVRRVPFVIQDGKEDTYRSLAYETVFNSGLKFSDTKNIEKIVFAGSSGSIRRIPFWRLFENNINVDDIKNSIIFIGSTATNLHDEKQTPFDRGTEMSGVEIQAQIANMLLNNYRLNDLSDGLLVIWIFIGTFLPFLILYLLPINTITIVVNLLIGLVHISLIIFLFNKGIVSNFVHINMAWFLGFIGSFFLKYLSVDKEKREMRGIFSKYVSADVLNEILKDPSSVRLGGEEREATIFFSDIRSFTTLSEGMSPIELTQFLNKYLTRMTNIILDNKGVVDKYIGDAIMAFWGAPIDNKNQALDAVISSLKMIDSLERFNEENKKEGKHSIDIGIGLNSGKVVVGNMGSSVRFDYTVMGDSVNLASRLEGQTKTYGVKIIISESVKNRIEKQDINKYKILVRELDMIRVKGKNKPVTIFEVISNKKRETIFSILSDYDNLRELYYLGRFSEALIVADNILKKTEDGPTRVLRERCLKFIEIPPLDWQGVYEMKSK